MAGEIKTLTVGQEASALDIFLTANSNAVSGKYVGFQLYDAANTQAVSGVALNPEFGHYVGSGTIPAGFQLGNWNIHWTIITQGDSLLFANEPFTVQDATVSIGFVSPTDKFGSIYDAVRIDIGDPDGIIFNDDYLKRVILKAVRRLDHRLGLSRTSRPKGIPGGFGGPRIKIIPLTINLEAGTLSPDNDELTDLVIMQMEVIILESEISALKRLTNTGTLGSSVGRDGISVTNADGVTVTISSSRLQFRSDLHKFSAQTARTELEKAILAYLNRQTGNYGKMVY